MNLIVGMVIFGAIMWLINRVLRRAEAEGDFDPSPSSASRPGLRWFFDYSDEGWPRDGGRQRPPD